jgi:hypothetical protein
MFQLTCAEQKLGGGAGRGFCFAVFHPSSQFSVGVFSTLSTTTVSTGPFLASSFKPN